MALNMQVKCEAFTALANEKRAQTAKFSLRVQSGTSPLQVVCLRSHSFCGGFMGMIPDSLVPTQYFFASAHEYLQNEKAQMGIRHFLYASD